MELIIMPCIFGNVLDNYTCQIGHIIDNYVICVWSYT